MKNTLFDSITISLSALALTTSLSAVAANTEPAANNSAHTENTYTEKTYTEKRSAAEFWADFKQDSKQTWQDSKAAFKDGWIESKLETALILNEHLNAFKIDIEVDKDMATLGGEVHSDIEKELAENIALGVEGIDAVTNNIKVIEKPAKNAESVAPQGRNFAQYVADVSTTAAIKTELLASPNIKGLAIDVDTLNHKVTLSGQVSSLEQKALAQAIAAKHENVKGVVNNLQIKS
ncbi:BON domain-containing protein [Cellvibrio sp. QJXJ]|uniref:BON domain-containing protein n=1 Tax=Cellvibrio sp. QJXJ TaxID=2964606 RepID=UPI0021C483C0|nr:BON domain-containing protein [Cellvibrio sp. QJXJ]UUA73306.1 BON domain-containing protein [Cellvibrio sp. QJXJ]